MHPRKSLFGVLGKKSRAAIIEELRDEERTPHDRCPHIHRCR